MSLSGAVYFLDTSNVTKFIINDMNSSSNAPIDPYWKVVCHCSLNVLRISPSSCNSSETTQWLMAVMLYKLSNSSFYWADKAMTSTRLAVPDLPLCPSPHQDAFFASLHFGPRGHLSPVSVADRLTARPLPVSSALPVIQALNSGRKISQSNEVHSTREKYIFNGQLTARPAPLQCGTMLNIVNSHVGKSKLKKNPKWCTFTNYFLHIFIIK